MEAWHRNHEAAILSVRPGALRPLSGRHYQLLIPKMSDAAWPGKRGLRAVPAVTSRAPPDVPMETKLHAPSVRKEGVERREVVSVLAGADAKLVLVEAPAASGKTPLVAQWRASTSEDRPFAWG